MSLGAKIRALRREKRLSAAELARRAQVTPSFISHVENGRSEPSIEVLRKVANGLGVPLAELFNTQPAEATGGQEGAASRSAVVVRREARKKLVPPGSRVVYELLTPDLKRNIEFLWVELSAGQHSTKHMYTHPGEECVVVVEGSLHIWIENEEYDLEKGDSIWFECSRPHRIANLGKDRSITVWAIHPPYF